jgi:hypothetical protein
MNGIQIERVLTLIDGSIHSNMNDVHAEILSYLGDHEEQLAQEISSKGYALIPTRFGSVKISREDLAVSA